MREKVKDAGLNDIILYVGGNIVVGKQVWSELEEIFKAMWFDRVFRPWTPIEDTTEDLKKDLWIA